MQYSFFGRVDDLPILSFFLKLIGIKIIERFHYYVIGVHTGVIQNTVCKHLWCSNKWKITQNTNTFLHAYFENNKYQFKTKWKKFISSLKNSHSIKLNSTSMFFLFAHYWVTPLGGRYSLWRHHSASKIHIAFYEKYDVSLKKRCHNQYLPRAGYSQWYVKMAYVNLRKHPWTNNWNELWIFRGEW